MAAHYANDSQQQLSESILIRALRVVVETHSALRLVGVKRASPKRGCHRLWIAALHEIDLAKCIEFVNQDVGPRLFETAHNEWSHMADEPTRPYWKLLVTPKQDIVLVYHHMIADGISGYTFHRSLLRALNSINTSGVIPPGNSSLAKADPANMTFIPNPVELSPYKASLLLIIYTELCLLVIRLLYGNKVMFKTLPPPKPYFKEINATPSPEQRTITMVSSIRIPAKKMKAILDACRKNGTTFTPLLITLFTVTFSIEFFPGAKIVYSRYAYNIRRLLQLPRFQGLQALDGPMMNAASGVSPMHHLAEFRRVIVNRDGKETIDTNAVWKLARDYKIEMGKAMPGSGMRTWMGGTFLGPDLEDFVGQAMPSIGRLTSETFLVSNLGPFSVATDIQESEARGWTIDDVQFSVSATNGGQGSHGFIFNVAGLKSGAVAINAAYEEEVVSREMADAVLASTMAKIESLI